MAQQFSLPQKHVLKDLDGEDYNPRPALRGPLLSSPRPGLHLGHRHRGGDRAPLAAQQPPWAEPCAWPGEA